ncbi:MAG: hypothetical protein LBB85_05080 [Dysgonamonadaceae bacterium]|jgi:hypothetical protein|nr:hypothetical protein [Dysgonamonadaceae bacterium]
MGFFDKIRKGRLFFGKKEFPVIVKFFFRGQTFILEEFDVEFRQATDEKNRPSGEMSGGLITITISDPPGEQLTEWMINPYEKREGEFRFLRNENKIQEGALLHIFFREACCTEYHKVAHPHGAGLLTTLVISPRQVRIGNEEFENQWKS